MWEHLARSMSTRCSAWLKLTMRCRTDSFASQTIQLGCAVRRIPFGMIIDMLKTQRAAGGRRAICGLSCSARKCAPVLGDRWVMLDLDCVILGNLRSLWNRKEEAVFWRNPHREWPYNGAMMMCKTGARDRVWSEFDPHESPRLTHRKGYRGSDQAWISYCLGSDEAVWTQKDGVYFLPELRGRQLDNAKIVFTTAATAPWTDNCPKWMKRIYRDYLDNSDSRPASSLCTV
jgi:hypothetical protein